jgi:hypothetical protein
MTKFNVLAALRDEANEGWVWTTGLKSRTVVCITNPDKNRSVFCQVRTIDENFRQQYEQSADEKSRLNREGKSPRLDLNSDHTPIVMSQWYRDALGARLLQRAVTMGLVW